MHSESDTRPLLISFFNMVETQFHVKIKSVRSDNGIEFEMIDFFNTKGIIHQTFVEILHNKIQELKENTIF